MQPKQHKLTRRQMLGRTMLVLGAAAAGYGFLLESRRLVVEHVICSSPGIRMAERCDCRG